MQLKFSEQQNRRLQFAADGITALLLSAAFVALWIDGLGLQWSPGKALSGGPLTGLLSAWNRLAEELGRSIYLLMPRFTGGVGPGGESLPQGLFLTLAALVLAALLLLMIRSRSRAWLLLLVLPWLLLMFWADITPGFPYMLAFAGALALAWVQMEGECFRRGTAAVTVGLAVALCLGAGFLVDRGPSFDPLQITVKTGAAIDDVLQARYGHGALLSGRLNALDGKGLTDARGTMEKRKAILTGSGKDATQEALQVKGKDLESYYLRGYVGEKYKGDRWEHLSNSTYYGARDEMYWLDRSGFDGLSQANRVAEILDGESVHKALSIKVEHGDRSQLYLPYENRCTESVLPAGSASYAGGFLGSTKLLGSREYRIPCTGNMTGNWTDWVGRLYSENKTEALEQYFAGESHYNVWCYQKDTEVPDKVWQELYAQLGDPGEQNGDHMDYKQAIRIVNDYLEENCVYSEHFRPLEKKEDFLLSFLKAHKGCDVHYASLATMMFRFYRIPARYVEGYLLTPADVQKGGTVKLGQSHQHAWTEIYVDGYGWVPLEVTPEYRGIMKEANMERGLQSISYESNAEETPPPGPDEETELEETQSYAKILKKILLIIGAALLGLLVLFLLVLAGRRCWILWRRHREFTHPDPRHGVCAIYGYMLDEKLPLSPMAQTIGDAAAFSRLTIREEQRVRMRDELTVSRAKAKRLRKQERKHRREIRRAEKRRARIAGRKARAGRRAAGKKEVRA